MTAGDGLTHAYTVTVTNGGPSDATAVGLTVGWPAGFSQGAVSPSQGSCAPIGAGPDLTCSLGTIAAGGSATVSVAYTVPAATPGGPATATATVSSPAIDPVAANNSATDATTVVETAVLVVTKDDGLTSVLAGTTGHAYTITVTNSGPSDADSVRARRRRPGRAQRRHAERRHGRRLHDLGRQHDRLQPAGQPRPRCDLDDHRPVRRRQRRPGPDRHQHARPRRAPRTRPGSAPAMPPTSRPVPTSRVTIDDGLASVTAGDGLTHAYTITVTNGGPSDATAVEPHRRLAGRLQPGRGQPVAGDAAPRSAPGPTSPAAWARSRPAGAPRSASPTPSRRPPPADPRARPRPSAARPSTRSPPTTARPTPRPSSRPPAHADPDPHADPHADRRPRRAPALAPRRPSAPRRTNMERLHPPAPARPQIPESQGHRSVRNRPGRPSASWRQAALPDRRRATARAAPQPSTRREIKDCRPGSSSSCRWSGRSSSS